MSTFYAPGCKNDKGHICDCCEIEDGRPTLYWGNKDFDLCYDCLEKICVQYLDISLFSGLKIIRAVIPEYTRNNVFKRDGHKCVKCGSGDDLCLDHIKPFSRGGATHESNLQTLCRSCNSKKGDK